MLTLGQRREFARRGASDIDATIKVALVSVAQQEKADQAARLAAYEAKHAPVEFTEAEYKAARVVRDAFGWHKVVRANAKSVTVETGYSWTDRIARAKVLEVRA